MRESRNLIREVIRHNSSEKNTICCIEEMSELTKVLTKRLRNSPKFKREDLVEELGHVMLMTSVIAVDNDISMDEIKDIWQSAVDRMYENK